MADIEMYEGSGFNIYISLVYGENFDGGTEGNPIPRSSLSRVWFYVKPQREDDILFQLSDRNDALTSTPDEIQWTNESGGLITVKILDTHTSGSPSRNCIFELWGKLASNDQMVLLDRGTIDILDSVRV